MIRHIVSFSIEHKFLVFLLTLALIGGGIQSMLTLNLGSVPDITNNQIQVMTVSPDLGAEDIEQFVTYPVELAVGNLPGVIEIRSVSRFGLSVVTIVFEDDMGTFLPRQLVQEKLSELQKTIPTEFGTPSMGPISTGLGQIYEYALRPEPGYESLYSPVDLRTIQDWIVKRQLTMLDGVVEVNSFGGFVKQYEVALDPARLRAYDLTLADVYNALARNNANTGGAYIERNNMATFIRGEGLLRSLKDIRQVPIRNEGAMPITVGDIADSVRFGRAIRYGAFTQDGAEAVGGIIMMLKGANPNATIQRVQERMASVQKSLPEGIKIDPFIDRSELISRTTETVIENLSLGALIVIFALVLLLGSLRGGILVATTIPLSLLFAFILMKYFGVWANLMSLGAIDFGIIVDGAVIIVEGTVFSLQKRIRAGQKQFDAASMDAAAREAAGTMMGSAVFGQLIILIVFVPVLFLTGVEGKMFQPMAYTFGFAMIGAIVLCLTYVPMMSALLLRPAVGRRGAWFRFERGLERFSDTIIGAVQAAYRPLLEAALTYRIFVIALAVALILGAVMLFGRLGGEFIPQLDEGDLAMQALVRPGSALPASVDASIHIEKILLENFPEVKTVTSRIGVADIPTDPMPMDVADMYIILEKDRGKWVSARNKNELIEKIEAKLSAELVGVNFVFTQPVELRFNELLEGIREDIAVKLYGEDLQILSDKAAEIARLISNIPGAADVSAERIEGVPQLTVRYDRDQIARYNLNIEDINRYINAAFGGGMAGVIFEGEKRFDLVVRLAETYRDGLDDLRNLFIDLPDGTQVPLREVADVGYRPGPAQISRDNTSRRTYVGVNVRDRDVESVVHDIQEILDENLDLPPGYYITYGGEFENLERAKARLQTVVPIALALIFALLYFALGSVVQATLIFVAIPLAAVGGVLALWLRGMPFSISAGVGFIVLFGIAVLNGLVLISRLNALRDEGLHSVRERILLGTKERIRPILLTATTDIFGFLPMAFSTSAGAEVQRPLATVVVGGMLTATFLTLIVLPVLYAWIEKRRSVSSTVPSLLVALVLAGVFFPENLCGQASIEELPALTAAEARTRALASYPRIRAARLEVDRAEALKKTAWNLGNTQVFTAAEEAGQGAEGVYTILGIQQSNMDVLGVGPALRTRRAQLALARGALNLTRLEIEREVSVAWAATFTQKKQLSMYRQLDSLFKNVRRAAELQLELEADSRLAYLATVNQANQIHLAKEQAYYDYLTALQRLNLWFGSDTMFTVSSGPLPFLDIETANLESPGIHPALVVSEQQVELANTLIRERKADYLPKLQAQYGTQRVGGERGFFQYQIGFQVPLFYTPTLGRVQAAEIDRDIAVQQFEQKRRELESTYQQTRAQFQKWRETWRYYQDEALPLAREQRAGATVAFREGAIDYIAFLQLLRPAIRTEIDAWEALGQYLGHHFQLRYFLGSYR